MAKKKLFTTNPEVLALLERIKQDEKNGTRRYNKLGEWMRTRECAPFTFDKKDMKYIMG